MRGLTRILIYYTLAGIAWAAHSQERVIYQSGFENVEGFNNRFELIGQNDWTGQGTGGNGLDGSADQGVQAYVGYYPPTDTNIFTSVWRPLNLPTSEASLGIVKFSVTMRIIPSTNNIADDFRWSVYNTNGSRLLSLDFDTATREISYVLDDGQFVFTNLRFELNGQYDLAIYFNFSLNHWTAALNDVLLLNSKPITTKRAELNLGDIDAVWEVRTPFGPGNNYMLFDNYKVAQLEAASISPFLESIGLQSTGEFLLRVHGEEGLNYDVDVTENFEHWFNVGSLTIPASGTVQFQDTTAPTHSRGFYRVLRTP